MIFRSLRWTLGFSLLAAAPASAQPTPAQPLPPSAVVMDQFARCIVERHRASVVALLGLVPGTPAERQRLSGAIAEWGSCMEPLSSEHISLVFQPDVVRGPFAEALYERDFAGIGQPRAIALATLADPLVTVREPDLPQPVLTAAVVGVFSACVALRQPAAVAALFATAPASAAEGRAIEALMPEFGPCFPVGSQFDITIPLLRGYLAEALYRHAAAVAAPQGRR